ncbi:MAG: hypothetical protein H7329_03385 [Opitutaceae bacterium]|nr:hypothetical protein [Cytophagales bacterium]
MNSTILIFLFLPVCLIAQSFVGKQTQDTIYSQPYPNGIITKNLEDKMGYRFNPIENPNLDIVVSKKETIKIAYSNGKVFENPDYKSGELIILSTDPKSGKIFYSGLIDSYKASSKKTL